MHFIFVAKQKTKNNLHSSRGPLGASDLLKHRLLKLKCLFRTESFSEGTHFHANEEPKLQQFMCILWPLLAKTLFCSNKSMWVTHCSKISLLSPNWRKVMLSPRNAGDSTWRDYLVQDRLNHQKEMLLQYIKVFSHTSFQKSSELRSDSNPVPRCS